MYGRAGGGVTGELLWRLLDILLPNSCLACGEALPARGSDLGLCPACLRLRRPWPAGCSVCGGYVGAASPRHRCSSCLERPPPYERLLSAWVYQPPLDAVVAALKFQRLDYLGRQLGEALAESLAAELDALADEPAGAPDLVVPVPLYWRRQLGRGYNQAAEIARPLAEHLEAPIEEALRRRRSTPPQTSLDRAARAANLRRAFALCRSAGCCDRHVLLVDDVVTTGSTLVAASEVLRHAGARAITAVVAARTPDPREAAALRP